MAPTNRSSRSRKMTRDTLRPTKQSESIGSDVSDAEKPMLKDHVDYDTDVTSTQNINASLHNARNSRKFKLLFPALALIVVFGVFLKHKVANLSTEAGLASIGNSGEMAHNSSERSSASCMSRAKALQLNLEQVRADKRPQAYTICSEKDRTQLPDGAEKFIWDDVPDLDKSVLDKFISDVSNQGRFILFRKILQDLVKVQHNVDQTDAEKMDVTQLHDSWFSRNRATVEEIVNPDGLKICSGVEGQAAITEEERSNLIKRVLEVNYFDASENSEIQDLKNLQHNLGLSNAGISAIVENGLRLYSRVRKC